MHRDIHHRTIVRPSSHNTSGDAFVHALTRKHFGAEPEWPLHVREFLNDITRSLRSPLHNSRYPVELKEAIQLDSEEFSTIRHLQNLIVRLRRNEDGSIVYTLREGRLAGENTTSAVRDKPIEEFLDQESLQAILPHVQQAFAGEAVQFEYVVDGRTYLRFFAPIFDELSHEVTEVVGSLTDISAQKETERQLRSSEHLFRKLIDSIPIGILKQELHADGLVHDEVANTEFQRISGYSVDELWAMTNETRMSLIHPAERDAVIRRWTEWQSNPNDGTLNLCYRFLHRSGEYRTFQNYLVKFHSEAGNLVCVQAVLDVTTDAENERQLRHLASYLEQSVTPIFEITESGELRTMNGAAKEEFNDLVALGMRHALLADFPSMASRMHQSAARVFKRVVSVGSDYYEQHVYFMPEAKVYRIFCHNITTLKRAEEELRESLEKERALSLLRSTFIDTISHEFRTPLTGINTSAELLQRYDKVMNHDERVMHLEAIRNRVQEIVELVARFTTQSSMRNMRDSFTPADIDLVPVVQRILEETRSFATDRKQKLVYEVPTREVMISGDERLLRHAIRNILLNAIQYSAEGSSVQLRMCAVKDAVQITVIDEGVGIPERELELLFTPYFRGTNSGRLPGSGLGISIAKEFIELHKGSVEIQSRVGIGTTVVLTIPMLDLKKAQEESAH